LYLNGVYIEWDMYAVHAGRLFFRFPQPSIEPVKSVAMDDRDDAHTPAVGVVEAPARPRAAELWAKSVLDVVLAALGLLVLSPLLFLLALAIHLDSTGPALFRQTRTGLNGKPFRIYKFRTMSVQEDGATIHQATRNDPRVTRIGHWLRSTGIDELPQLLNVIRGEMALVGPRPHALAHDKYYGRAIPAYVRRFAVKPGITGWAQVNGLCGETPTVADMQRRVGLDLWYIEHWSLALDVTILVRTVLAEITRRTNTY
jgi:exopolysaccharide biosynthesis polyprenyl glycosylphosphotransferase